MLAVLAPDRNQADIRPLAFQPLYLCVFRAAEDITDDVIGLGQDPDFRPRPPLGESAGRTSAVPSALAVTCTQCDLGPQLLEWHAVAPPSLAGRSLRTPRGQHNPIRLTGADLAAILSITR